MRSSPAGQKTMFALALLLMSAFLLARIDTSPLFADPGSGLDLASAGGASSTPRTGRVLFAPVFGPTDRLVSNDYAFFNPTRSGARRSADWLVTSGSLFAHGGAGWSGVPDAGTPDAASSNATGSAVFRAVSRREDFGDVAVSFDLLNQGYVSTRRTPAHAWDGIHLFLHYRNPQELYALTVNRRDHVVLLKKKRPGGNTNGGTYQTIGDPVAYTPRPGRWQHLLATIETNPDATVTITLSLDGRLYLTRTDGGAGGPPLAAPGAIGLRGDNVEFEFRNLRVRTLRKADHP